MKFWSPSNISSNISPSFEHIFNVGYVCPLFHPTFIQNVGPVYLGLYTTIYIYSKNTFLKFTDALAKDDESEIEENDDDFTAELSDEEQSDHQQQDPLFGRRRRRRRRRRSKRRRWFGRVFKKVGKFLKKHGEKIIKGVKALRKAIHHCCYVTRRCAGKWFCSLG